MLVFTTAICIIIKLKFRKVFEYIVVDIIESTYMVPENETDYKICTYPL